MVEKLESSLGVQVGLSDWDRFYAALKTFQQVKGSLKVLARFTVPSESPWPEELWGYRLGVRVGNLRTTGRFLTGVDDGTREERIALLDELGFEWKPRLPKKELEDLDAWFNPIVDALKVYARMGGDISEIKPSFVVPDSIEWPEALRGMALGQKLAYLRSRSGILNDHPEKKEVLQDLGAYYFDWVGLVGFGPCRRIKHVGVCVCMYIDTRGTQAPHARTHPPTHQLTYDKTQPHKPPTTQPDTTTNRAAALVAGGAERGEVPAHPPRPRDVPLR